MLANKTSDLASNMNTTVNVFVILALRQNIAAFKSGFWMFTTEHSIIRGTYSYN